METLNNNNGVYRFEGFDKNVVSAFSSRKFANVRYPEFLKKLNLSPKNLVTVRQVHGSKVLIVDKRDFPYNETEADGLITQCRGAILGIKTADCVPVSFGDAKNKVVGIAHAGWKGVKAGIISQMLKTFDKKFKTDFSVLQVAIGPAIRKCCYEVGREFMGCFPGFYFGKGDKGHLDLVGALKAILISRGVLERNIFDSNICTVCENETFYSYRKEQQTKERVLSVISMR